MHTHLNFKSPLLLFCLTGMLSLAACSIPPARLLPAESAVPSVEEPGPAPIAQTAAQLTSPAVANPDEINAVGPTSAMPSAPGSSATTVLLSSPSKQANRNCDLISPGQPMDVTVPDGTKFSPGEPFVKTWRLVNSGTCTWTREYKLVWFSGQPLGAATQRLLNEDVHPGDSVDIVVDMAAPNTTGSFQSNWKLGNAQGKLFGLGPNGDAPFWVQIVVTETSSLTPSALPSQMPPSAVYASGVTIIYLNDGLDLDSGEINRNSGDDIHYEASPPGKDLFLPQNEAKLAIFGSRVPTENECRTAYLVKYSLELAGIEKGIYLCYQTSQGLLGYAHVFRPVENEPTLNLEFVTWTSQ